MDQRTLNLLEFPRITSYLSGFTVSEPGLQAALALRPFSSWEEIERESVLFDQGRLWAMRSEARLRSFPPVEPLLAHSASSLSAVLDVEDLFALRAVVVQGKDMIGAMLGESADAASAWPLWQQRCTELALPDKTVSALTRCIADDGHIKDSASPELSLVRGELRQLHQLCARKVKEYATEYNILHFMQDTFMTLSSDRYVLPLKSNFKGRLQGVIHDYSQTGETCYFEPLFLVDLNNRLQGLKHEEREEERKILSYLSDLVRQELPAIKALYDFLVEIDLLLARTALADCYDGRILNFSDDDGLFLREARHPLLSLAQSPAAAKALRNAAQRRSQSELGTEMPESDVEEEAKHRRGSDRRSPGVVASTLELQSGQRALVISGGNAGGKTVSLKSVGLIALMAMCALPVPVEAGSTLPRWRNIHPFIGDEQNIDDNVSTFTAQITQLGRIWPELGSDSLVILDEFGAGTDPSQGAALAQAVVDSLMECGVTVIAATHFPALKAYALSTEGVRAASVLFDPQTKKPLFRLVYDQVGASQALDVAREHGLPEPVLRRAEQYLLVSGEDTTVLVERLNSLAVEREKELVALGKEKKSLEERRLQLRERFELVRAQLFDSVQADAKAVLDDWKKSKISHKLALKELSRIRNGLNAQADEQAVPQHPVVDLESLALRQRLRHIPWKRIGVLLEVDTRKKRVRLDFDGVSLWADAADIALPEHNNVRGTPASRSVLHGQGSGFPSSTGISSRLLPLSLDLRGLRADVALSELSKFLDGAILSGRDEVEIIHGRGTGVLRREVHSFLSSFPAVRGYRLAPEDQGGDGMTMVELA